MTPDEVMREVRRIEITTRHLVRDIVAGEYSSAFRGRGVEFSEVREYQPGDDVRTIDWNVTARLGTTYVKRYLEERELTVLFLIDISASGRFGSRVRTKQALATEVCAVLALAAARNHDRIGAVWVTDRVEHFVPPRRGRRHVLRIINDLLALEPAGTGTNIAIGLELAESLLRRRSVIFVLSDFLTSGYLPALESLARRHDVVALQLYDRRERELPNLGLVSLADPESGGWRLVDTGNPATRQQFRRRAEEFDHSLQRSVLERGGDLIRLETGRSYAEPLIAFFRRRELGKHLKTRTAKPALSVLLALAALSLLRPNSAPAQVSGQSFQVSPPAQPATVGDSVTVEFRVRLDERDLLFDTIPEPVGTLPPGVRVLSVAKMQRTPDRIFHGHARLAFYRPGRQPIPVFGLPFMRAVKGVQRATLSSDSAFVEIRPLLPAGNPSLKDIRDLERSARPPWIPVITGMLALVALLLARWTRRRKRRSETARAIEDLTSAQPAPSSNAYTLALTELDRIEQEHWPGRGQVARHYEAVVDTLRDYLESAEAVPARERTTAELLWSLPAHLSGDPLRDRFRELLDAADLVKFARLAPGESSAQAFLEQSRALLGEWHAAVRHELADAIR
jgi:uncharacterized protein (DUF58 family)